MDKKTKLLSLMLECKKYQTAECLAEELQVSSKTVRNILKELNQLLEKNGARIQSKYGAGYAVCIEDEDLFSRFFQEYSKEDFLPSTAEDRIQCLMVYLFSNKGYVKLDDLSEMLYISKKTLTEDLKDIERFLSKYRLKLIRKPNYGIRVEGKEFDLRLCIAAISGNQLYMDNAVHDTIASCISETCRKYDFTISGMAFQNLIVHVFVAICRIMEKHYVTIPPGQVDELGIDRDYQLAEDLIRRLEDAFSVVFPESEVSYMAIHLAGKKMFLQSESDSNIVITQDVDDIVSEMLELVYETFKFDFRNDLELRMSLGQHLVPMKVRMKSNMDMRNPILKDVKEKFCLSYTIASQAAMVLNRRYEMKVSEDEIGYIALAFALALERKKTEVQKKNILLVCASGRGSTQLLLYKYRRLFGDSIGKIEACDVASLYKVDFSEIDYVFTTVPISIKVPVPIQEVQYFLQDEDIVNVKKTLNSCRIDSVSAIYEEKLFLSHLPCRTKEETLKLMCEFMIAQKNLPPEFYQSVLYREKLARTAFGNMVAMPHPYKAMSEDTFVCVAVLDEPIDWDGQNVQVVFLVSLANKELDSAKLQRFYQMMSSFLFSTRQVRNLIKKRNYEKFITAMKEIESTIE